MTKITLERWYAYAVLSLRDGFRGGPSSPFYEWKARTSMVALQGFVAATAVMTAVTVSGWYGAFRYLPPWVVGFGIFGMALTWANTAAERRLLPRFEHEFHRLSKRRRSAGRIAVVLCMMLAAAAFLTAAAVGHATLCSKAPNFAVRC
jgi:diacylglycerol kinase